VQPTVQGIGESVLGADDERVVQLVPSEPAPDDGGEPPRPPPAAGAKRPALKRVK